MTTTKDFSKLNPESIQLSWCNIGVTLPERRSRFTGNLIAEARTILREVSGYVTPGTLLAIMGASGSGKTTLLNVLTQRSESDLEITGQVTMNGKLIGDSHSITELAAYVQQDDLFMDMLTVREHLWFHAMLRMDESSTDEQRNRRVDELISELGLTNCQHCAIGTPGKVKSISGGERKRLSFASEIINNPTLLFCDEPTSGLDSFMAESIVQMLKTMVSNGKTILCTIHQPSSQIFSLFDNLLLLARGQVAYMGPTNGAPAFFAKQGIVCPSNFNPADFYISTLAVAVGEEEKCIEKIEGICQFFRDTYQPDNTLSDKSVRASIENDVFDGSENAKFKTGLYNQMRCVSWRAWALVTRDRDLFFARLGETIAISIFTGLLYLNQPNNQRAIQNINGAIVLILANSTFGNAFSVVNSFPKELAVFKREYYNKMYNTLVYFTMKSLADIPLFTLIPVLSASIIYWMVGMKGDVTAFFIFVATIVFLTHVVVSFGYIVSCATGDVTLASALGGPLIVPFMLFGGFMLNDASIPVYFIWLQHLSWFKYAFEILVVNQWHNFGEIGCEYAKSPSAGTIHLSFNNRSAIISNNATIAANDVGGLQSLTSYSNPPCIETGNQILSQFNYSIENHVKNFACLAVLLVGFRIVALISLTLRVNKLPNLSRLCKRRRNEQAEIDKAETYINRPESAEV